MSSYSSRRPATREVIDDFLLRTAHLPPDEPARIAGVGAAAIVRWRRRAPSQLQSPVMARILEFLSARGAGTLASPPRIRHHRVVEMAGD